MQEIPTLLAETAKSGSIWYHSPCVGDPLRSNNQMGKVLEFKRKPKLELVKSDNNLGYRVGKCEDNCTKFERLYWLSSTDKWYCHDHFEAHEG